MRIREIERDGGGKERKSESGGPTDRVTECVRERERVRGVSLNRRNENSVCVREGASLSHSISQQVKERERPLFSGRSGDSDRES